MSSDIASNDYSQVNTKQNHSLADSFHMHHHNPPQPAYSPLVTQNNQNSLMDHPKSSFLVNIDEKQEIDHPFGSTNTFTCN